MNKQQREIKFRAWDTETKRWAFYSSLVITLDGSICYKPRHSPVEDHNPQNNHIALMQYTGLKDKHGVEIYEGDLLQHRHHKQPATIEWMTDGWKIKVNTPKGPRWHECYEGQEDDYGNGRLGWYEVIGNIYENPDLLKEAA